MTDEEKELVDYLFAKYYIVGKPIEIEDIETFFALIDKQQKEIEKIKKYCQDKIDMYNNSEIDELGRHEYYYPPYVDDILKILKGE